MSRENVETVQRVHDALARRDRESVLALYDPEIEMDFSNSPFADFMQQGRIQRHEGMRSAFRDWYDAWEEVQADLDELIDVGGDHVISVFTYRGRGRVSRVEVEWKRMAGVWTIRDGKVVRVEWLRTRDQALEATGLAEQAMSRENVAIVRRVYEAAARRDASTVLALHDPEVECDFSRIPEARLIGRGVFRGREELRAWFREWNEAWETVEAACHELIEAGDQVISVAAWRGLGRTSGVRVETPTPRAGVWTIQDGKVTRVVWFESVEEAREAAGLPE